MNVLLVNLDPPYPLAFGGVERFIAELGNRVSDRHRIHILSTPSRNSERGSTKSFVLHSTNTRWRFNSNSFLGQTVPRALFCATAAMEIRKLVHRHNIQLIYDFIEVLPVLGPLFLLDKIGIKKFDVPAIGHLW